MSNCEYLNNKAERRSDGEDWGHRTEREKEREIDVKREVTYAPAQTCRDKVVEWRVAITAG